MSSPPCCLHHDSSSWLLCRVLQLLLIVGLLIFCQSKAVPPFHPSKLQYFLRSRCNCVSPNKPSSSLWAFEGQLVDPNSNKIIAEVEGLEVVRILSECVPIDDITNRRSIWRTLRGIKRLGDLKIRDAITNNAESDPSWDYAGTLLSRKIFCYRKPGSTELISQYRIYPTSPKRKVKAEEAVAIYDTATTYISRLGGEEMEVVTEWPDGRCIQSTASSGLPEVISNTDDGKMKTQNKLVPFKFTTFTKQSPIGKSPSFKSYQSMISAKRGPHRSKFIQFGKDEDAEYRRYGARETYSYKIGSMEKFQVTKVDKIIQKLFSNLRKQIQGKDNHSPFSSMRYTRYGEAPPWYAPGKMCTLEIFGQRIDSMLDAPPLVANLIKNAVPGFMIVHAPIPIGPSDTGDEVVGLFDIIGIKKKERRQKLQWQGRGTNDKSVITKKQSEADLEAIKAVGFFREMPLKLEIQNIGDEEALTRNNNRFSSIKITMEKLAKTGEALAHRVCAATKISSIEKNTL